MRPEEYQDSPRRTSQLDAYAELLRQNLPGPAEIAAAARARKKRRRMVLGGLLVAACAGLWAVDPVIERQTLATGDESRTWVLSDGSALTLNRNTSVAVAMHVRSRQMTVDAGQALFDVSHSFWRRFDVHTAAATIEDIGTVFDVRVHAGRTRVVVVQGAVRVHGTDHVRDLVADQALDIEQGRLLDVAPVKAAQATAWRHGKLVFDATPFAEVARELERYGAPPIVFADPSVGAIPLSGQFNVSAAATLVNVLPRIADVKVSQRGDGAVLVSKN